MTDDTKRALEALKPLADTLQIQIVADETILYMNGDPIGIACNSTWATIMEAIGWIFLKKYVKDFRRVEVDSCLKEDIQRYWISKAALRKIMMGRTQND